MFIKGKSLMYSLLRIYSGDNKRRGFWRLVISCLYTYSMQGGPPPMGDSCAVTLGSGRHKAAEGMSTFLLRGHLLLAQNEKYTQCVTGALICKHKSVSGVYIKLNDSHLGGLAGEIQFGAGLEEHNSLFTTLQHSRFFLSLPPDH